MTTFRRLLRLTAGQRRWIAIGAALGFLAVGANVALMAMSAYLISRAAIVSNVAEVALVITAVRVLAIGRAAFRYLERYVTHRATFAILAELRVWFFASIEPLAPARLATRRSSWQAHRSWLKNSSWTKRIPRRAAGHQHDLAFEAPFRSASPARRQPGSITAGRRRRGTEGVAGGAGSGGPSSPSLAPAQSPVDVRRPANQAATVMKMMSAGRPRSARRQ